MSGRMRIVTPGENIGLSEDYIAGDGTYEANGTVFAALVGELSTGPEVDGREELRVSSVAGTDAPATLPTIGGIATVRIVKVTRRSANGEILLLDGRPLADLFKGTIRQQDVRENEIDKVEIYKCFAPGDIVRAQVISLGDRYSYFLSTAKNHLGVIHAKSVAGLPMLPINWQQMQCPKTKVLEYRKVAKIDADDKELIANMT